ncbi:hypothetical protein AB1Y20_006688 [Prymnesium parvum]|uniref:Condensin complex subunit 2 n=1 Tax=Prymnesium parvum TaxID=97485 RepID=A0AB34IZ04_PRYPA
MDHGSTSSPATFHANINLGNGHQAFGATPFLAPCSGRASSGVRSIGDGLASGPQPPAPRKPITKWKTMRRSLPKEAWALTAANAAAAAAQIALMPMEVDSEHLPPPDPGRPCQPQPQEQSSEAQPQPTPMPTQPQAQQRSRARRKAQLQHLPAPFVEDVVSIGPLRMDHANPTLNT